MTFPEIQADLHIIFTAVLAIIAILNPFGNLPQYLAMTEGMPTPTRQKLFRVIGYTAFIIVMIFTLTGPYIMKYLFKIEIRDLRIAGGLILIIMGVKNLLFPLKVKYQGPEAGEDETEDEIIRKSIIPMAFPMMVGPGTLATMIVISADNGMIATLTAASAAFLFILALFHFSASIERVFGKLVLHVIARIMQVFIVAIGVKMIMNGMKDAIAYLTS